MISCFLSNISAKYYKNPLMLSRVIAKNVGDVFLRHSVDSFSYISLPECVSVSSTTFMQWAPKATKFGEITQTTQPLRRSRSPILVPIERLYTTSY